MKITKPATSTPAVVPTSSTTLEATPAKVPSKESGHQTSVSGASSQMQLLNLAKQFVLDGGLVSPDKQMPLEDRSRKRERLLSLRKQQNMESIIQKALAYCSESEITDKADHDWFNRFISLAEDVSNKTMQELWAKILSGEISQPGTFSLKALKIFRNMSINDAKLLAKACSLAVKDQGKKNIRIISGSYIQPGLFNFFDKNREQNLNLSHHGLSYADLLTLSDNNLLFIQETESSSLAKGEQLHFLYNGSPLDLVAKGANTVIRFYKFTPVGSELASLIGDNAETNYLNELKLKLGHHFQL
ncbi:TIGR03899 family protein [Thalassomonas actiniarum]|uniref:TIGR03899 family protein n=1 Tax=Thalassomonas actiniarum TaxID=485447 RepID=A0AAF0C2V6_9GAMM|nr:TIGR03899 family protein [Thalassomonas actiniarum]WDD98318.1 TIGR03899 family protein [Thalassomonas actiniarum]